MTSSSMDVYWQGLREQALALPYEDPPAPWTTSVYIHAGGVIEGGWDSSEHVLLVSHDGYSLTEPRTGRRVERNRNSRLSYDAISPTGLTFTLPTTQEVIAIFGRYGGGGSNYTQDSWHLSIITPMWPEDRVILWDPSHSGPGAVMRPYFHGAHYLRTYLAGELHGCSFAPSGKHFMVVASDGALVVSRD